MLVVDAGIGIPMSGLTVTETSYLVITSDQSCGNFIMLAPEIVGIRDSRKYVTCIRMDQCIVTPSSMRTSLHNASLAVCTSMS